MYKDKLEELQELLSQMSKQDQAEIKDLIKGLLDIIDPLKILVEIDEQSEEELTENRQQLKKTIETVLKKAQVPNVITKKQQQ